MINNYIISMIRSYRRWGSLVWINILSFITAFALIITLIRGFIESRSVALLVIILLIVFIVSIAYVNFIALQLRSRKRELHIRKLLGAGDRQLLGQLLAESMVLVGFLVVSGLVLAEFSAPYYEEILGSTIIQSSLPFTIQVFVVLLMVLLIGLLAAIIPISTYIKKVNNNFGLPTNRH